VADHGPPSFLFFCHFFRAMARRGPSGVCGCPKADANRQFLVLARLAKMRATALCRPRVSNSALAPAGDAGEIRT